MLSHDKLLACLIYLGYPVNIKGMCYGVALMGAQAILANDMKSFRERLNYLKQIDEKKLAANIEEAEKIRLSIIQGLRSDLGDSSDNQTFNAYVVSMEKGLKPNVRIALSIKNFFDGISLYFHPHLFPHVFPPESKLQPRDPGFTSSVVAPVSIATEKKETREPAPALKKIHGWSGAYTLKELEGYFNILEQEFKTIDKPVSIVISSANHTISVGFTPERGWTLIDANQLELADQEMNTTQMANAVLKSLSKNDKAVFTSEIFVKTSDEKMAYSCSKKIFSSPAWKELHDFTKKTDYQDSNDFSWLFVAAQNGYVDEVKSLIESKANVNANSNWGTAIIIAAQNNHFDIVDFLINKNADVNQNVSQLSALYLAAQNGHVKIVNRILEEKDVKIIPTEANKSVLLEKAGTINKTEELEKLLKSKNIKGEKIPGFDALHAASFFGHIEVVKSLIAHGYNPSSGKITAAEYAKAMGHTQIETMLNEFEKLNKVIKELNHLLSKYDTYKKSSVIVVLNGALEKAQLKIVKEKESPSNVLKELLDTANDLSEHPESATIKTKAFLFLRPDSLKTDLEKIIHSASKLEKKYNL